MVGDFTVGGLDLLGLDWQNSGQAVSVRHADSPMPLPWIPYKRMSTY